MNAPTVPFATEPDWDIKDLASTAAVAVQSLDVYGTLSAVPLPQPSLLVLWLAEMSSVNAIEAWAVVVATWSNDVANGSMSEQTADKYARATERFIRHAALNGHTTLDDAAADVREWVFSGVVSHRGSVADAAGGTIRLRRSAVQKLYAHARRIGLTCEVPTIDMSVPQGTKSDQWRPATDAEVENCRAVADLQRGTRGSCIFAFAICGASTGEIGQIMIADVDLRRRTLHLPGTSRTIPRTVTIHDDWALEVISDHLESLAPLPGMDTSDWAEETTVVKCARQGLANVQSSVSQSLGELIRVSSARRQEPTSLGRLSPSSIPAWAATKVFETSGDITEVARFMGVSSLDLAAQTVLFDWSDAASSEHHTGPGLAR